MNSQFRKLARGANLAVSLQSFPTLTFLLFLHLIFSSVYLGSSLTVFFFQIWKTNFGEPPKIKCKMCIVVWPNGRLWNFLGTLSGHMIWQLWTYANFPVCPGDFNGIPLNSQKEFAGIVSRYIDLLEQFRREGHKNDQWAGKPLLWRKIRRIGVVQHAQEEGFWYIEVS